MSKFEWLGFSGGYDSFAVSKEKYTAEQALEIARDEIPYVDLAMGDGFVRHRSGVNEDGEPCVCWWLEYQEHKMSCACYVFHATNDRGKLGEYKYFKQEETKCKTNK